MPILPAKNGTTASLTTATDHDHRDAISRAAPVPVPGEIISAALPRVYATTVVPSQDAIHPLPYPPPEINVALLPDEKGVESLARQIRMAGRAFILLFDIARLILQKPERQQVRFEVIKGPEGKVRGATAFPMRPWMTRCGFPKTKLSNMSWANISRHFTRPNEQPRSRPREFTRSWRNAG